MSKSIVLIGPMGAGKTTLGKRLAKTLKLAFTDTDKLISRKHGSIPDIFTKKGEAHFRQLESAALEQALETGGVIATGGGIVLSEANRALLKGQRVIFLDTTMDYVLKSL
ncbi:MAG: shikimate kinase, partial [Aquiluna sp.]|nr:shikimate kinase [Aquiluna sp.]